MPFRGRLERFQRDAIVRDPHQSGLAVCGQSFTATVVVALAVVTDFRVLPALVVLRVQNGHFYALVAAGRTPQRVVRPQWRYPQAIRRVHSYVRSGHAVGVVHVVIVVIHFQVGRVVPVYARVRAAGQRVVSETSYRGFVVQRGRR